MASIKISGQAFSCEPLLPYSQKTDRFPEGFGLRVGGAEKMILDYPEIASLISKYGALLIEKIDPLQCDDWMPFQVRDMQERNFLWHDDSDFKHVAVGLFAPYDIPRTVPTFVAPKTTLAQAYKEQAAIQLKRSNRPEARRFYQSLVDIERFEDAADALERYESGSNFKKRQAIYRFLRTINERYADNIFRCDWPKERGNALFIDTDIMTEESKSYTPGALRALKNRPLADTLHMRLSPNDGRYILPGDDEAEGLMGYSITRDSVPSKAQQLPYYLR